MELKIKKNNIVKNINPGKVLNSIELTKKYNSLVKNESKNFKNFDEFIKSKTKYFHGTFSTFDEFSLSKTGKNTGWNNAKYGIFFSDNMRSVEDFLEITKNYWENGIGLIKERYLKFEKSLDLTIEGIFNNKEQAPLLLKLLGLEDNLSPDDALTYIDENIGLGEIGDFMEGIYHNPEHKKEIIKAGYDSIISSFGKDDIGNLIKEYVAFHTQQIFTQEKLLEIYKNRTQLNCPLESRV